MQNAEDEIQDFLAALSKNKTIEHIFITTKAAELLDAWTLQFILNATESTLGSRHLRSIEVSTLDTCDQSFSQDHSRQSPNVVDRIVSQLGNSHHVAYWCA